MTGFKSIHDYREFADTVQSKRRFLYTASVTAFLKVVSNGSKEREAILTVGKTLWRAQTGSCDWHRNDSTGNEWVDDAPFPPERMTPPTRNPSEGRLNPRGIAYLYLASDKKTAISEVRPSVGSLVTVAQFETTREMRLVDFSKNHAKAGGWSYLLNVPTDQWDKLSQDQIDQAVWADIDNAFSLPANPNEEFMNYVPTQILAESLLAQNYDGIVYRSGLNNDGYNFALFEVGSAIFKASRLFTVTHVDCKFTEHSAPWVLESGEYFTTEITDVRPIGDNHANNAQRNNIAPGNEGIETS